LMIIRGCIQNIAGYHPWAGKSSYFNQLWLGNPRTKWSFVHGKITELTPRGNSDIKDVPYHKMYSKIHPHTIAQSHGCKGQRFFCRVSCNPFPSSGFKWKIFREFPYSRLDYRSVPKAWGTILSPSPYLPVDPVLLLKVCIWESENINS
jgi:hypothetical protein